MSIENEVYYIYEGEACWCERLVEDDENIFYEEDNVSCTEVKVNPAHYYKGYFFYNDMDDYEDKEEHYPVCFNNEKDLDDYIETNNSSGHFQCTYIEEWVNGKLINTKQVSDADGYLNE